MQRKIYRRNFDDFESVAIGGCGLHGASDVVQPVAIFFRTAIDDIKEHALQFLG